MMRAASAGPMPGSFSSSWRDEWFMEISGAPSGVREARGTCITSDEARRGSLTQEGLAAAATQHRMIQPRVFRKRIRSTCESRSSQRVCDSCRESVQNARSLKLSGTCNAKKRDIHRVFHSFCGKVGESFSPNIVAGAEQKLTKKWASEDARNPSPMPIGLERSSATFAPAVSN